MRTNRQQACWPGRVQTVRRGSSRNVKSELRWKQARKPETGDEEARSMSLSVVELVETGLICVVGDAAGISVFWRCWYHSTVRGTEFLASSCAIAGRSQASLAKRFQDETLKHTRWGRVRVEDWRIPEEEQS